MRRRARKSEQKCLERRGFYDYNGSVVEIIRFLT
jgi:hypothetical protein